MAITAHKNLLIILFLGVIISVSSLAIEKNVKEETGLIRQRRQSTTLTDVLEQLIPFVQTLLYFVSFLLIVLGLSLPIILGALGLGGLGAALGIIVIQLGIVVAVITGKKRRDAITLASFPTVDSSNVCPTVNDTLSAVIAVNNLVDTAQNLDVTNQLNTIQTQILTFQALITSGSVTVQQITDELNGFLVPLNAAVVQIETTITTITTTVQANTVPILSGPAITLNYLASLGSTFSTVVSGDGLNAVTLIFQNTAAAINATVINFNNLNDALSNIRNATVGYSWTTIVQLGNTVSAALASCTSSK